MTYTDLVHELTDKLLTDLEKVRYVMCVSGKSMAYNLKNGSFTWFYPFKTVYLIFAIGVTKTSEILLILIVKSNLLCRVDL